MTSLVAAAVEARALEQRDQDDQKRPGGCSECGRRLPKRAGRPRLICGSADCANARARYRRDGWRRPRGWKPWKHFRDEALAEARRRFEAQEQPEGQPQEKP